MGTACHARTPSSIRGAEFLVLGHLLMHRILSYNSTVNMPGYDLVAVNPEHNTSYESGQVSNGGRVPKGSSSRTSIATFS